MEYWPFHCHVRHFCFIFSTSERDPAAEEVVEVTEVELSITLVLSLQAPIPLVLLKWFRWWWWWQGRWTFTFLGLVERKKALPLSLSTCVCKCRNPTEWRWTALVTSITLLCFLLMGNLSVFNKLAHMGLYCYIMLCHTKICVDVERKDIEVGKFFKLGYF